MDELQSAVAKEGLKPIRPDALWRQETYLDIEAGEIKCMIPVTLTNVRDPERGLRFFSSIVMMFRGRPMEIKFEVQASTLAEAVAAWHETASKAGQQAAQQMEDQARSAALVVPPHARTQRPN
jgi:hypothetical protein